MPDVIHDPDEYKCKSVFFLGGRGRESWILPRENGSFTEMKECRTDTA